MRRDNQPWQPLPRPELSWTAGGTPRSARFDDIYYSPGEGLAESRHVFLAGNDLPARWAAHPRREFVIAETGFGTGLNFLLTWQAWAALPAPRPRLHFVSVEQYPLREEELRRALAGWEELAWFSGELLAAYPDPVPGVHRRLLAGGDLCLDLWWGDAGEALADLARRETALVDAWYLDGFAPSRNEAMWAGSVLDHVGILSRPGATLATFTAAGAVRRALQSAGFEVNKTPGYGRKRERLVAHKPALSPRPSFTDTPWEIPDRVSGTPLRALVIGAGLAGCATAAALANRGIDVTLLDRGPIAGEASGNRQGVLYTRLSPRHSALADFAQLSFLFSARQYARLFESGALRAGVDGELCGSFHQVDDAAELATMQPRLAEVPGLAAVLDSSAASDLLGVGQHSGGYWYPRSGWLAPAAVCRAWLAHPRITLQAQCGPLHLAHRDGQWAALAADGATLAVADCAVIACAADSRQFGGLDWLPLQAIRGQTTDIPPVAPFDRLQAVLCHTGYVAPSHSEHCIGATFHLGDTCSTPRVSDHRENLEQLAAAVPEWAAAIAGLDPARLEGRVGFRCASPDYLPLAGPVPDLSRMLERFAGLRQNARRPIAQYGAFMPGLFLNTGHGSRGLTSTPIAAELLASMVCNEPLPLPAALVRALAPARFPIRDLGRNRR